MLNLEVRDINSNLVSKHMIYCAACISTSSWFFSLSTEANDIDAAATLLTSS